MFRLNFTQLTENLKQRLALVLLSESTFSIGCFYNVQERSETSREGGS